MASTIEYIYDKISDHFNNTRQRIWGYVKKFLNNLEPNSTILEIGCGNGKNMLYRKDLDFTGIDISQKQVDICLKKQLNVLKSNMTELPFQNSTFEYIICIATYHHLDNDDDRKKALYEMYRTLKTGGKILLTVWAMEQSLTLLGYKSDGKTYLRYYHIYREGELVEEINRLCPLFKVLDIIWELGNWVVMLGK